MFPLYDESARSRKPPYLTILLIVINVIVFLFTFFNPNFKRIIQEYGTVPNQILRGENPSSLLSSLFLHAGFLHLIGNMWFLWIFGNNVEYVLGKIKFIIFYLLVGILASLAQVFTVPEAQRAIPTIGASGAISGLLGGYLVLFPRNKIRAFIMLYFRPILFDVPAFIYIGIWFLYQILYIEGAPSSIAYMAHIGGFVAGAILILLLRKKTKTIKKNYVRI